MPNPNPSPKTKDLSLTEKKSERIDVHVLTCHAYTDTLEPQSNQGNSSH